MTIRRFNWPIWAGFLLSLIAFISYFLVFVWFPITRDFPWANLLLFALSAVLVMIGVRRAYSSDHSHPRRSKIFATILMTLSLAIFGFFVFSTLIMGRRLPASHSAPTVGRNAPDFTLPDSSGKPVSLSELLTSPVNDKKPTGVLLVFYRGYW